MNSPPPNSRKSIDDLIKVRKAGRKIMKFFISKLAKKQKALNNNWWESLDYTEVWFGRGGESYCKKGQ